jgi:hypothetical protein
MLVEINDFIRVEMQFSLLLKMIVEAVMLQLFMIYCCTMYGFNTKCWVE